MKSSLRAFFAFPPPSTVGSSPKGFRAHLLASAVLFFFGSGSLWARCLRLSESLVERRAALLRVFSRRLFACGWRLPRASSPETAAACAGCAPIPCPLWVAFILVCPKTL